MNREDTFLTPASNYSEPAVQVSVPDAPGESVLLDAYSNAVISASEKISPSVVKIDVAQAGRSRSGEPHERQGGGSGFVFTPDGLILTNSHVVHGATRIQVSFSDGHRFPAHTIGDDPATDLAVIRIDAPQIVAAPLGDSQKLRVGQLAIAIGNPYGFQYTVTIMGAQGLCFAIGINTAKFVAGRLLRDGRIRRAYIRVEAQTAPLHRRLVRFYNLPQESGVIVSAVTPGSPAQRAGLREGDVIVALDGKAVAGVDDLHRLLTDAHVGVSRSLTVLRWTEKLELQVVPQEARSE